MLVSPTEPPAILALGKTSSYPERYGADILIARHPIRLGIQRKTFPQDFVSSLGDGRLYEQAQKLKVLEHRLLILEGYPKWTLDGTLWGDDYGQTLTRAQVYGILFTAMMEFGLPTLWVQDIAETAQVLRLMEAWLQKDRHLSLSRRPNPVGDSWGRVTNRDYGIHWWQGFPGVGPVLAERLFDGVGVPVEWTVGTEELMGVEGVGKEKAERILEVLAS